MQHRRTSKKGFFREKSFFHLGKGKEKRQQSFFREKKLFREGKEKQNNLLSFVLAFAPLLFSLEKASFLLVFFSNHESLLEGKTNKKEAKKRITLALS